MSFLSCSWSNFVFPSCTVSEITSFRLSSSNCIKLQIIFPLFPFVLRFYHFMFFPVFLSFILVSMHYIFANLMMAQNRVGGRMLQTVQAVRKYLCPMCTIYCVFSSSKHEKDLWEFFYPINDSIKSLMLGPE